MGGCALFYLALASEDAHRHRTLDRQVTRLLGYIARVGGIRGRPLIYPQSQS
jgi:hypothetical protein